MIAWGMCLAESRSFLVLRASSSSSLGVSRRSARSRLLQTLFQQVKATIPMRHQRRRNSRGAERWGRLGSRDVWGRLRNLDVQRYRGVVRHPVNSAILKLTPSQPRRRESQKLEVSNCGKYICYRVGNPSPRL